MAVQFLVGVDRTDITPSIPLPLCGMGNDYVRKENFIFPKDKEDFLFAETIVISDGTNTAVLCVLDTLFIHRFFSVPAAKAISEAVGIPEENVFFTATHTHSGVSMAKQDEDVLEYNARLIDALALSAKRAMSDLSPAKITAGSIKTEGLNFQRRFIFKDGSHRCTIADKTFNADEILGYETEPDNILRALRFIRDGKKDLLIANWQAHPGFTPSFTVGRVSADYIGSMRCIAEENEELHFVFIQGAAGNMEARTRFKDDPFYEISRKRDRTSYAKELVRIIKEDISFSPMQSGEIKITNVMLEARQKQGKTLLDATHSLPLCTITFGDVAICGAPNELYSDSGLDLRRRSPYKATLLCTNANGYYGYLPIKTCFDSESYEMNEAGDSFGVRVSKCECGTAERVIDMLVEMLG